MGARPDFFFSDPVFVWGVRLNRLCSGWLASDGIGECTCLVFTDPRFLGSVRS